MTISDSSPHTRYTIVDQNAFVQSVIAFRQEEDRRNQQALPRIRHLAEKDSYIEEHIEHLLSRRIIRIKPTIEE